MSKSLSYILMLDVSGSMMNAIEQVKINAHSFAGWSRIGDQFGINAFSDDAKWIYPTGTNPNIITILDKYKEVDDSYDAIEGIRLRDMTNIGDAIRLGNNMIQGAKADNLKAFVLLSDGIHNKGTDPELVLGNTPPLYVAGLGSCQESYFLRLIKKNPRSKFHNKLNAYEMTLMFNDIVSESTDSALVINKLDTMRQGAFYTVEKFNVSREGSDVIIQLVWNGKKYKYTNGDLKKDNFKITIMDPADKRVAFEPVIIKDGYCVYRLKLNPGEWKVLTEYSINAADYCTFGGVNFSAAVRAVIDAPAISKTGEPVKLAVNVLDGNNIIENAKVTAHIERPVISVEKALEKYKPELDMIQPGNVINEDVDENLLKLEILRKQKLPHFDILERKASVEFPEISKDGTYNLIINDVKEPGLYVVSVTVEGKDPQTGFTFTDMEKHAVIVT